MNPAEKLSPLYFGAPERPLFGCYHEPALAARRSSAVVVCQPVGHEYINSHRALRQLAFRLCDVGFPVLRFDYYGCGDSSGRAEEGSISQWREDTLTAVSEVRRRSAAAQVCLLGLRLGGTLAWMAAAGRDDLQCLILWDPVLNGKRYLDGLRVLRKESLRFRRKPYWGWKFTNNFELFGFGWPYSLRAGLERIDLLASSRPPAENVLVVGTNQEAGEALSQNLQQSGTCVDFQRVEAPQIWLPTPDGSLLVPGQVLQTLVSWVSRTQA